MKSRGRTLRFAVVSAAVVLCLTGFTTGRGHGHGHHGDGGGGGGCSSSGQDHDSSSSSSGGGVYKDDGQDGSYGGSGSYRDPYDDNTDDDYGSDGGGSGSGTSEPDQENATVRLLSCATKKKPYATVEVTNLSDVDARFTVTVSFKDARDVEVVSEREEADVPANGKTTVRVPVSDRDRITRVDHCDLDPEAPATG